MYPEASAQTNSDSGHIFYELTRSVCPTCLEPIDAQILIGEGRVVMRKRCPSHGWTESLVSSDAEMYLDSLRYNKPGSTPLGYSTQVVDGCPKARTVAFVPTTSSTPAWAS